MALPVGHGRLGVRSNLRTFSELLDESASTKRVLLELRPGQPVTGWSLHSGSAYAAPFEYVFDGVKRDVVSCRTLLDTGLTRVESVADCVSTAGTYYYDDPYSITSEARWDDDVTRWDDGIHRWDQFPRLYIHLTDDSNPSNTTVVANVGIYLGVQGATHPALGDDKLSGSGEFETLTGWTQTAPGGGTISLSTTAKNGTYSVQLTADGSRSNQSVSVSKAITLVAGMKYRLCGYYQTTTSNDALYKAVVRIGKSDDTNFIASDGRSIGTSTGLALDNTGGAWRRFIFDFVAYDASSKLWLMGWNQNAGRSSSGTVRFDGVTLHPIWRYNYYEPRMDASSIPESMAGSNDVFFGGKTVGTGSVQIINADGLYEPPLADLDWLRKEAIAYAGHSAYGQELTIDDYRKLFVGFAQRFTASDKSVQFDLEDSSLHFYTDLPLRVYQRTVFDTLDTNYDGTPRPLWFGVKTNVTPVRISRSSTTLYGTYEVADCDKAPNGIKAIDAVYSYLNSESARNLDTTKRLTLSAGTDYSTDLANGQLSILRDVHIISIDQTNDILEFNDGTDRTATIPQALYTPHTLATAIVTAMNATGSTLATCTYSDTTHMFTVGRTSGTCTLMLSTGTKKERHIFKALGFTGTDNKTGSSSYTAESALFDDADKDHIIRVDGQGYKDDASGTYTGSANALIELGSDICRVLLIRWMGKASAIIDSTSFAAARARAPEPLCIYLRSQVSSRELFDRLEHSNIANIVLDGQGKIYYEVYTSAVPSNITDFYDRDYIAGSWEIEKSDSDVYGTLVIKYNEDPSLGTWSTISVTEAATAVRHGRTETKSFETFIRERDEAHNIGDRMLPLAKDPARVIRFAAKGKLVDKKVGDKIRLTRSRAVDSEGSLDAAVMRIIDLRMSHLDGMGHVRCVDDIATAFAGAS